MDIDPSCLAVMDLTANDHRIGMILHFDSRDSIRVDVALLKVTLAVSK